MERIEHNIETSETVVIQLTDDEAAAAEADAVNIVNIERLEYIKNFARAALSNSDTTLIRCYEAGIPLPAEWVAYRKALRSIISSNSGDPTQPLPTRPAYPEGT